MTENHRAEGRLESVRLRRMMGTGVIADSFGDSRYAVCSVLHGMRMPISWKVDGRARKYSEVCLMFRRHPGLDVHSSTHSLGDLKWKAWGVTAEPEVKTKLIESERWCKPYPHWLLYLTCPRFSLGLHGSRFRWDLFRRVRSRNCRPCAWGDRSETRCKPHPIIR